jgi:hypothetical protein
MVAPRPRAARVEAERSAHETADRTADPTADPPNTPATPAEPTGLAATTAA